MGYSALVIDDDIATRTVYSLVLSPLGFKVLEAGDGEQAMNLLAEHVPQVVLLDLRLPVRSGYEVLDYLYNTPAFNDTRVVVITAMPPDNIPNLRQNDRMTIKPVLPHQIRELVGGIINS